MRLDASFENRYLYKEGEFSRDYGERGKIERME